MYCPKCGQQQASEEMFFCSRCGFKLDVVRTSLTGQHDRPFSTIILPQHRDINSGIALMLLGTLFTSGLVVLGDVGPAGAFLILTLILISVLLSSRHLMRAIQRLISREDAAQGDTSGGRKGMCFGALLMYIGTVLTTCAATMVTGRLWVPTFFFTLLTVFALLLLFSKRLMQAVQDLMTVEEQPQAGLPRPGVATASLRGFSDVVEEAALPPSRFTSVPPFSAQRVSTAEIVAPPSVTERTTNLLDKKADSD